MQAYQRYASTLDALLGSDQAVRIIVSPYMPLSVEHIGTSGDGNSLIAISHTVVQNGDRIRDPELVFEIFEVPRLGRIAEPISMQNDFVGLYEEVFGYDDRCRRTYIRPRLKAQLEQFATMWFRNLRGAGLPGR